MDDIDLGEQRRCDEKAVIDIGGRHRQAMAGPVAH